MSTSEGPRPILERMVDAVAASLSTSRGSPTTAERANARYVVQCVRNACPEIAALDHAREGWLVEKSAASLHADWHVYPDEPEWRPHSPVLVIPKPEDR